MSKPNMVIETPSRRRSRRISGLPPELKEFATNPTHSVKRTKSKPKRSKTTSTAISPVKSNRSIRRPQRRLIDLAGEGQPTTSAKGERKTRKRTPVKAKTTLKQSPARSQSQKKTAVPRRRSRRVAARNETTSVGGERKIPSAAAIAALSNDELIEAVKPGKEEITPTDTPKDALGLRTTEVISYDSDADSPKSSSGDVAAAAASASSAAFRGTPFPVTAVTRVVNDGKKMTNLDWTILRLIVAIVLLYFVTLSRAWGVTYISDEWVPDWIELNSGIDPFTVCLCATVIFALASYYTREWCNDCVGDKLGLKIGSMEGMNLSNYAASNMTAERTFFLLHIVQSVLTLCLCVLIVFYVSSESRPDIDFVFKGLKATLYITFGFYLSQLLMSFIFGTVVSVGTVRTLMIIGIGLAHSTNNEEKTIDLMVGLALQSLISIALSRFIRIGCNRWLLLDQIISIGFILISLIGRNLFTFLSFSQTIHSLSPY